MSAQVVRLRTKADYLQAEQADLLRRVVLSTPGLPADAVGEIVAAIDAQTASTDTDNKWPFVMLSPADNDLVTSWLDDHSSQPRVAVRLWLKLFLHMRRDTGEIVRTREQLAEAARTTPREVSRIMGELESIGAITREVTKVPGMRGPGTVRYRMNPLVATHLGKEARARAQSAAKPVSTDAAANRRRTRKATSTLSVIQGGGG